MIDAATYHLWHGILPMETTLRDLDPGGFLVSGTGNYAVDRAGRRYLDARSSMWNVTLGYSCEPVKQALRDQLGLLPAGTILRYESPPEVTVRYAAALAATLPGPLDHVRFGHTGSQMTEAAVMVSRFHRRMTGQPDRTEVVALSGSYHGSGPLATALTGEPVLHDYSAPLDTHVRHAPRPTGPDDRGEALITLIDQIGADRVTAVMVEPVLGSFVQVLPGPYLAAVAAACRERGIHLIADEVTTGAGRAGALTAVETHQIVPDLLVLGKGLSAGYFPLAALVVSRAIFADLAAEKHMLTFPGGSTTDGHPLGMAAGLAVLDILTADGFLAGVRETGRFLAGLLAESLAGLPGYQGVRGTGLMLGVELGDDGTPWSVLEVDRLRRICQEHGLLTSTSDGIMPLFPPLTLSRDECAELVDLLGRSLQALAKRRDG